MDKTAFSILAERRYRRWFLGQAAFLLGNKAQGVALAWIAYQLTGSVMVLGVVAALTLLPYWVLGPLGGWLADHCDERRLVLGTQIAFALNGFTLALLQATGWMHIEALLFCALAAGVIGGLDSGPRPALVQRIVGERARVAKAVALNALAFHASRFIGPALAGVVLAIAEEWVCFLLSGLASLPLIAVLARLDAPREARSRSAPGLLRGFAYAARHGETRALLLAFLCVGLLAAPYLQLLPYFAKQVYAGDARHYGLLFAISGLGSLAASLYVALRGTGSEPARTALTAFTVATVLIALFAATTHLGLALIWLAGAGFGFTLGAVSLNTRIQLTVPLEVRGRVLALITMAGIGSMPLGTLLIALMADAVGTAPALMAGALTTALVTTSLAWRRRALSA